MASINRWQRIRIGLIAWCVALLVGACHQDAAEPDPIRIGLLVDFGSTGGPPSMNAAKLFARQANEHGGIMVDGQRRPLELVIEDTHLDPGKSMTATRRLVYQERVHAIIGPNYSSNVMAAAPVVEAAEVVLISPGATLPEASRDKRFVFRVAYDDPQQGRILAEFAVATLGLERLAVLYDVSNPSSRSVTEALAQHLAAFDTVQFEREAYVAGEESFDELLDRLLASEPQGIVLPNPTSETLAQARVLAARGYQGIVLGSDNWGPDAVASEPSLNGAYYTQHWNVDPQNWSSDEQSFVEAYRATFKSLPTPMAALTHDALTILTQAMQRGGTNGVELAAALRNQPAANYLTGRIDLQAGADQAKRPVLLKIVDGTTQRQTQ